MRALKVLVVVMGVLIVFGTAALVVAIVQKVAWPRRAGGFDTALAEATGSRIAGVSEGGGHLAVWLQGGGPDRVVIVDERDGRTLGRVRLDGLGAPGAR